MELRRSLLSKAMRDMQKLKDHDGNKITQSKARSDGYEVLIIPPDENLYGDPDLGEPFCFKTDFHVAQARFAM